MFEYGHYDRYLRRYLAAEAMLRLVGRDNAPSDPDVAAQKAVEYADALIKRLAEPKER